MASVLQTILLPNKTVEINLSDNITPLEIEKNDIVIRLEGNLTDKTFNVDVISRKRISGKHG
jgi:hypothetical protein